MTDLIKLKEILDNQQERGVREGIWERTEYIEQRVGNKDIDIIIENMKIGFTFNKKGRFKGIYNI